MKRVQAVIVMAFMLLLTMGTAASAHSSSLAVQDCTGWMYSLSNYDPAGTNSVQVWIDGVLLTDNPDFGTDNSDSGVWTQNQEIHTMRVKVVAWDDPTGERGFTFDDTLTAEDCPVTTTTSTTTTTTSTTTTTPAPSGRIGIIKTANPTTYGTDGIGYFTIQVTNPGPVDLTDVHVTDDVAVAIDPTTNCVNDSIGDLAVGQSVTYTCTVANLDGSPFNNIATAIGIDTQQNQVTDTDDALVTPVFDVTVTTQPPTTEAPTSTTPTETLPVTGVDSERLAGFGVAGVALVLAGVGLLGGAALIGRIREERR